MKGSKLVRDKIIEIKEKMDTRITKMEKEIGKSLNNNGAGSPNVSTAIKKVSDQYSKGKVTL